MGGLTMKQDGVREAGAHAHGGRRADILAAAIRVLARDGIAQATTRKIAAEAGLNQATVLYYAGSKDELLLAVLREMMRTTREIALAAAPAGGSPRAAIRQAVTAFWEHVEAAPELQVMQYELTLYALRHPESAWLAREQYAGYCEVVEGLLRDAFAAAGASCLIAFDALARFIVGGLDGLILQFVSDRDVARARRDLDALVAAIVALAEGAGGATVAEERARSDPAPSVAQGSGV
jgi:AcrR family transcriptional regulator